MADTSQAHIDPYKAREKKLEACSVTCNCHVPDSEQKAEIEVEQGRLNVGLEEAARNPSKQFTCLMSPYCP